MRTLWLQWGGNKDLLTYLGLPQLPYPLCYNVPRTAWSDNSDTIVLAEKEPFCIYIDLLAEIYRDIGPLNIEPNSSNIIGSFRICVGKGEKTIHIENENATTRDIIVGQYYSRFHDNSNLVSKTLTECDINTIIKNMSISINGHVFFLGNDYFISEKSILFLAEFTTLHSGDLVSLGTLAFISESYSKNIDISIDLNDWHFCYRIVGK